MSEPRSSVFIITCECCGSKIHVDGQTRSIFYTEHTDKKKKRSFEEVVEDVTSVGARAQEKFEKNLEKERSKDEKLADLFKKAREKADENPDERPPSIFDYD